MKTQIYLMLKYWRKHKKNAAALLFSGVLTVAVVFVALMQFRGIFNRALHKWYDRSGMYDLQLPEASQDIIDQLIDEDEEPVYGYVYVLGKMNIGTLSYTYGYADDPSGLMHIPFESGVMPTNDGEIAIDRGVLNNWNWAGTLGDSITLDGKTYSVVGIIDELYGIERSYSELWNAEIEGVYPIPLIYIAPPAEETPAAYTITLVDGIVGSPQEIDGVYVDILHYKYEAGEEYDYKHQYGWSLQNREYYAHVVSVKDEFVLDVRWVLILSGIAVLIAILSVFSVLRGIFIERQSFVDVLRRTGMAKKDIRKLYALECAVFIVVEIIIGTLLGVLGYSALNAYQIYVLGQSRYSAFTTDVLVTSNTLEPFVIAAVFGIAITVLAYLLTAATTVYKPREKVKQKRPRSLRASFSAVFRQRGVTVIQIVSLSLIGFGVMLGYMYYTRDGKELLDHLKYDFPISYYVGKNDEFDMKDDAIAEYYYCGSPASFAIQTYEGKGEELILADNNFTLGMDDSTVDKFSGVTATGELEQTFVISDTEIKQYSDKVVFSEPELELLVRLTSDEYKNFWDDGNLGTKHLYRLKTMLTNTAEIEKLSEFVIDGEINIAALNDGSEVIIVADKKFIPYSVGEVLRIGSVMQNDTSGIGDVVETEVRIGAVAFVPESADEMLRYAVKNDQRFNMLTTAAGASANGLHNSVYSELFASEEIDGGLIPTSSGAKLTSYKELKRREFLENAVEYGGLIMLFTFMSLLGFSAYFSGIGIKIRQKAYEISALRAVGMPLKRIRAKLLADALAIPVIAAIVSGGGVFAVQRFTEKTYEKLILVSSPEYSELYSYDEILAMKIELLDKYFLESQMWSVPTVKPMLIILAVMCVVTATLTLFALKKFKGNIAGDLSEGRKRR